MLYEIMKRINNFFVVESKKDTWTIEGGKIALPFVHNSQYFLIKGSVFNDGVYKLTDDLSLTDETFDGYVSALAIPPSFLELVNDIEVWQAKNGDTVTSPFQSESFSDYSYTKSSNSSDSEGSLTWYTAFKDRLSIYRKV